MKISNFIPKELRKLFGFRCLGNYYGVITANNNGKLAISGTPPPTLGGLYTIPQNPKGKTLSRYTKFLQHVRMYIRYGDCVALGGHNYIRALVDQSICYVYKYGMQASSGSNIIQ